MIDLVSVSHSYSVPIIKREGLKRYQLEALKDINLSLKKGETLAVIGHNGAGKTTLLKVIGGLIDPEGGKVHIKGKTACVLDMNAGFHPDLTGRENCVSLSPLFETSKEEIGKSLDAIGEFSELGEFFDAPIRTYSQGMFLRLAFSFAVHLNPDIFIIDDIMAVGDIHFRHKCTQKIDSLIAQGVSFIFASHDVQLLRRYAVKILWLEKGKVRAFGDIDPVLDQYFQEDPTPLKVPVGVPSIAIFQLQQNENSDLNVLSLKGIDILNFKKIEVCFIMCDTATTPLTPVTSCGEILEKGPHFLKLQFAWEYLKLEFTVSIVNQSESLFMEWKVTAMTVLSSPLSLKIHIPLLGGQSFSVEDKETLYALKTNHYLLTHKQGGSVLCEMEPGKNLCLENDMIVATFNIRGEQFEGGVYRLDRQHWHYLGMNECLVRTSIENRYRDLFPHIIQGNEAWSVCDRSLEWRINNESVLDLAGFEILFQWSDRNWSSTESIWSVVHKEEHQVEWLMRHDRWPFKFRIWLETGDGTRLKIRKEDIFHNEIRNVKVELILKPGIDFVTEESGARIMIGQESIGVTIESSLPYTFKHSVYDGRCVLYGHIPVLLNGDEWGMCFRSHLETLHDSGQGVSYLPECVPDDATTPPGLREIYLSFESRCLWYDTRDALQVKKGSDGEFYFYETPVLAKYSCHRQEEGFRLTWHFSVSGEVPVQRIQVCLEFNEGLDFLTVNGSLLGASLSLISDKTGWRLHHTEKIHEAEHRIEFLNGAKCRARVLKHPLNTVLNIESFKGKQNLVLCAMRFPYPMLPGEECVFDLWLSVSE